jgi:hypothetical protein
LHCPETQCKKEIDIKDLEDIVDPDMLKKYYERTFD